MKNLKRVISLILCFVLVLTASLVVTSADEVAPAEQVAPDYGSSETDYPIIFVTGIGQSYSYLYANEEDAKADIAANETDRATAKWNLFCNDFSFALKEAGFWTNSLSFLGTFILSAITDHNFVSRKAVDNVVKILFR